MLHITNYENKTQKFRSQRMQNSNAAFGARLELDKQEIDDLTITVRAAYLSAKRKIKALTRDKKIYFFRFDYESNRSFLRWEYPKDPPKIDTSHFMVEINDANRPWEKIPSFKDMEKWIMRNRCRLNDEPIPKEFEREEAKK